MLRLSLRKMGQKGRKSLTSDSAISRIVRHFFSKNIKIVRAIKKSHHSRSTAAHVQNNQHDSMPLHLSGLVSSYTPSRILSSSSKNILQQCNTKRLQYGGKIEVISVQRLSCGTSFQIECRIVNPYMSLKAIDKASFLQSISLIFC